MHTNFGPWTTAICAHSPLGLSTFWKRRMKLLPKVCGGTVRMTRWTRGWLILTAVAACALPTLITGVVEPQLAVAGVKQAPPLPEPKPRM